MATKATIHERGNGLPDVGAYVPGDDGELYAVTKVDGSIQTGNSPGCGNWIYAELELADWDDVEEDDIFPAGAVLELTEQEALEEQQARESEWLAQEENERHEAEQEALTYEVFDADPAASGPCGWEAQEQDGAPDADDFSKPSELLEAVLDWAVSEAAGLSDYSPGDTLWAIVWDAEGQAHQGSREIEE